MCDCGLMVDAEPMLLALHKKQEQHVLVLERQQKVQNTAIIKCDCGLTYFSCNQAKHESTEDHLVNLKRKYGLY